MSSLELYEHSDNLFFSGFIGSTKTNLVEGAEAARGGAAAIGIRPEHLDIVETGGWEGRVILSEHLGSDTFLRIETPAAGTLTMRADGKVALRKGRLRPRRREPKSCTGLQLTDRRWDGGRERGNPGEHAGHVQSTGHRSAA